MKRHLAGRGKGIAIGVLAAALTGCLQGNDHVMEGDGNQVRIQYFGDIDATVPLARQYCAQFERVPRLRDHDADSVTYSCVGLGQPGTAIHG